MLVHPVQPSDAVFDRLHASSVASRGLKLSCYVAAGARPADVDAAFDACWDARPGDTSVMLLRAVLDHVRANARELGALHRGRSSPPLACFALVDGSVHEDEWLELHEPVATQVRVGPRFLLTPLRPAPALDVPSGVSSVAREPVHA